MAIKISGTTVIDDSRNINSVGISTVGAGSSRVTLNGITGIASVGSGITMNGNTGDINISGILTVGQLSVPISVSSFDPAIGSTSVGLSSNIILNFNQTVGLGTTGFFQIRTGLNTTGGTLVESLGVSSSRLTLGNGGRRVTVDPTSNFGFNSSFYVTMSSGFVVANGSNFAGINTVGTAQTYFFTTRSVALGDPYEGGFLICKASPLRWVVSPISAEVSRSWYLRNDANTTAQSVSGCTGWFVPTISQLQNPGYICRSFWGPSPCYSSTHYWSSQEGGASGGCHVNFANGNAYFSGFSKNNTCCVRAFRCVTY
jgi:hypothetical protein